MASCCSIAAAQQAVRDANQLTLQLHDVRLEDVRDAAALAQEIVGADRVALITPTRQIAVFATVADQRRVTEQLKAAEKTGVLYQVFNLADVNRDKLEQAIRRWVIKKEPTTRPSLPLPDNGKEASEAIDAEATTGLEKEARDPIVLQYQVDPLTNRMRVWGSDDQLKVVGRIIDSLVRADRPNGVETTAETSRLDPAATGDGIEVMPPPKNPPRDEGQTNESAIRMLPMPRGPVSVTSIDELDLLLIRGSGPADAPGSDR